MWMIVHIIIHIHAARKIVTDGAVTSLNAGALPYQFLLNCADVRSVERLITLERYGRRDSRALAAHGAAHHVACGGVGHLIAADAAAGDEQVADAFG